MKQSINVIKVKQKNSDDCWAIAISKLLKKPYDEIFNKYKVLEMPNGGLDLNSIKGIFSTFPNYDIYNTTIDLVDAFQLYDNSRGILFLMETKNSNDDSHAVYIKKDTIYDNIELNEVWWYMKNYKVISIILERLTYK